MLQVSSELGGWEGGGKDQDGGEVGGGTCEGKDLRLGLITKNATMLLIMQGRAISWEVYYKCGPRV